MRNLNSLLYQKIFFYRYIVLYKIEIIETFTILLTIFLIKKYHIGSRVSAIIGFVLLFCCFVCNLFLFDDAAGIIAQFVFIFFAIAFIQEFITFVKHEK